MIWHMDYINGVAVCWYTCPSCGYDTRNQQYIWSDRTYKAESEEISDRNMKMWEELFKAESEVRNDKFFGETEKDS